MKSRLWTQCPLKAPKLALSLPLALWPLLMALACWCAGCGRSTEPPKSQANEPRAIEPQKPEPGAAEHKPEPKAPPAVLATDSDDDKFTDDMEASLGTSPLHADTDGDGFSDYQEAVEFGFDAENDPYKFNPRIADIQQLDIEISKSPQVHFEYTTGEGKQKSIEIGNTTDNSWSTQNSFTHGVSVGVTATVGTMAGASATAEYSYQYSRSASREHRLSLAESQSNSQSQDKTSQGGKILVGVKLHNPGNVELNVESLRLLALKVPVENPDKAKTIGQLELDTKFTFGGITKVKPHSSTPDELLFRADLNLSQMKDLVQDGSLVIRVADFSLAGAETFTDINAKTAAVVVDPGPGENVSGNTAKTYLVAVPSADGTRGISAGEALRNVLHLKYESGTTPWKFGDPATPEKLRAGNTRTGLRSLLGRVNDYELNGYWLVRHASRAGVETKTTEYSPLREDYTLDDIRLHSGHILELTYFQDTDRDGLEYRTELMLGTDPRKKDTDGDGLTDGEEVVGWSVAMQSGSKATQVIVRSDPMQEDPDGDGFSDAAEKGFKTHPLRRNLKVPSVVAMDEAAATKLLRELKLTYKVTTREEEGKQQNVVLEQSPRAGDLALEGAEIALVVSSLPPQVTVPSVVGKPQDEATRLLKEAGLLSLSVTNREDWDNKAGLVLEQSAVAGTKFPRKETVTLVVAKKPAERWIEFKHDGAYVAKFYLSWEDDKGPHTWASGKTSAGYSHKLWFETKNPRNIKINAQAMTGLFWQPWGTIWDLRFDEPPNSTYTAKGTTLHRTYHQ